MKRKSPGKALIFVSVFAVILVGLFFYLSNRTKEVADGSNRTMTDVEEVLSRNLETNYPATPKEVLKYYSEITRCFYSEKYSDEELVKLAQKSRQLFDAELLFNQTDEQYLHALQADIASYKEDGKVISSYSVSSSTDVQEYSYGGYEWAQLYCIYNIRVKTQIMPIQERFLLRRDEKNHWKIVGWDMAPKEEAKVE